MYPMEPTQTEILNAFITENAPKQEAVIKELIDNNAANVSEMSKGVSYYFNETDIGAKKRYYYEDGKKVEDTSKPNNKLPHGWHNLLTDQKVSYLTGNPMNFSSTKEQLQTDFNEAIGDEWDDTLAELVLNATNKGKEWLHPYIDEEGTFSYVIIPAEQFIPLYDQSKRKKLVAGIRYYDIENVTKIEVWDEQKTTFYEMVDGGEVYLDVTVEENPTSHFSAEFADKGRFGFGWGKVPFIEFKNNEQGKSDLYLYKKLADEYDKVRSNFADELDDIPEATTVIKGYEGTSAKEVNDNLRLYKTIMLSGDENSGVDKLIIDIPVDAKKEHIDRLSNDIFTFGKGVNVGTDKFGNSPSGVALKFLYSLLDMKCSTLENKFKKALKEFTWFVVEYLNMQNNSGYDYKDVSFTFNKSMIMNELEAVQMASQSKGIISDKTILVNHPWVTDAAEEEKQLEQEKAAYGTGEFAAVNDLDVNSNEQSE